ncbi:thioredoxin family protein, selenocysteine-containing [Corallococcus macrosporus]|uniref:Thioredoxin family protein, selenocysteine-containing n=2 Tax=Myxococcaceae TaxID=31 RepID=F8C6T1_MYXFH|nr:thioredoxin family protein, selenocysteine-containing [Corallococcus macrosporus]
MRRSLCVPLLLALALLGACDRYDRPGTPVPERLRAETLDGVRIDRAALLGRPWVINVWAPG